MEREKSLLAATTVALFLCSGASASVSDPATEKPVREKIDVPLEHGSYRLLTEAISYEIFAPNSAEAAKIKLKHLRDVQTDIRICINGRTEKELEWLSDPNKAQEQRIGITRSIVWVSDDGRDFAEAWRPPVIDAPDGTRANHRREVVQRPRYWESVHIHETPAYDDTPPTRSVTKQSLTFVGACTGREFNLSPEWNELVASMKKPGV